jgi:hypothetical protein
MNLIAKIRALYLITWKVYLNSNDANGATALKRPTLARKFSLCYA